MLSCQARATCRAGGTSCVAVPDKLIALADDVIE
jgi:hypothetical protein